MIPSPSRARRRPPPTFAPARAAGAAATAARPERPHDDITEAGDSARRPASRPPAARDGDLDDIPIPTNGTGEETIHRHNEEIIKKKLAGFGIPAEITGCNAGPW